MITHAITVRQPWAWAIAEAQALTAIGVPPKLRENRGKPIPARHLNTRIGVHAGQEWSEEGAADHRIREAWGRFRRSIGPVEPSPLLAAHGDRRTGAVGALGRTNLWIDYGVIAVATVAGCHPAGPCVNLRCHPWGDLDYKDDLAWHIELADVVRLREPVPARGQLAVPWRMPEDVAAQVQAGYDKAVAR